MSLSERGYDIGSAPGWGLLDECEDTGEGVTDVFKLIIEVLAVPCEPVLDGLEQVVEYLSSRLIDKKRVDMGMRRE